MSHSAGRAAVLQRRSTDCFEVLGDPRGELARVQLEHLVLATFFDKGGGAKKREALRQLRATPLGARLTRLEFTTPKDEWEMPAP